MHIIIPKKSQLKKRIKTNDEKFLDFIKSLLEIDPNNRYIFIIIRPTAQDAMKHPWLN